MEAIKLKSNIKLIIDRLSQSAITVSDAFRLVDRLFDNIRFTDDPIMEMKPQVGLKYKKYYGPMNINNIDYCEVRAIVDNKVIVSLCKKQATKSSDAKEFYIYVDKDQFDYFVQNKVYLPL